MKGYKRWFIVFWIFLLITGMLCPEMKAFAVDKAVHKGEDYKVSVKCGIDGFAAYDYPTMVQVTVESKYDLVGSLRVIPESNDGMEIVAYGEDISLAANQAKTFTFYMIKPGNTGYLKVELLDENGNLLYNQTPQINLTSMDADMSLTTMIGVLSDDYNALNYFDGISFTIDNVQHTTGILELTKDSFPEDSGALAVLHYIIIDNFDTANLSDEQYAALKQWVNNGGILILALGSNYQNVLHCFSDDFVTGTIGNLAKKNLQWNYSLYDYWPGSSSEFEELENAPLDMQNDIDTESEDVQEKESDENIDSDNDTGDVEEIETNDVTDAELEDEMDDQTWIGLSLSGVDCLEFQLESGLEMIDFSADHTAYYRSIGLGRVVVLAYSLGMEPMVGYTEKTAISGKLLAAFGTDATNQDLNNSYPGRDYNGIELARLADTTRKPSALLYGAILLLYVVLVGPILYLILKAVKKREKIWVAIPTVVLVFTGIIFLTGLIYRVNKPLVNTFSMITLEEDHKTEKIYTSITCPKAKQYTVAIQPEYGNIQYNSSGYRYSLFDTGSSGAPFDYMIKRTGAGTELVLNNTSTFNETTFNVQRTDENDIGMIECDLKCYTTGFEGTVTNRTGYDLTGVVVNFERNYYQIGDLKKGEQITIDQSKLIPAATNGYNTFENLYRNMRGLYTDSKLYTQYQIDTMMEGCYVDIDSYGRGCVWARLSSYAPDFIGKSNIKQSGIGLIYQTFHADYEDVDAVYYPNLNEMAVSMEGSPNMRRGSFNMPDPIIITYSFEGYPEIAVLENANFDESGPNGTDTGMYYANVFARNPQTNDYEQIFVDSGILSGADLKKYTAGNILVLKFEPVNDLVYDNYMPRIIARGE